MAIQFDHTANGLVTITTTNAASPTPYTLRLPNGTGTNGQFLSTDGTGNLSFSTAASTYESLTTKPAVNVTFTGDVTGSGNVLLATSGTNLLSISMDLSDTGVTAGTYGTVGTANTFAAFTVDVEGRITSASNVTPAINYAGDITSASKPAINLIFTGDVTGSGNLNVTNSGTNSLSIGLTVQPNSVALGTDTTGNYTANVLAGTGIVAAGTTDEGNVITISLTSTGVTASSYGNARIVPAFTVDGNGRITAASNIAMSPDVANISLTGDVTGTANVVLGPVSTAINITTTIQPNSVALGTDTTGQYVANVNAGTAIVVTGTTDEGNAITIAHADTSSVSNLSSDNSNGVVIQDISLGFDGFGHVTSATVATTDLDGRYLRLSGATSQTVQGNLVFEGNVNFLGNVFTTTANNLSIAENFIYLNDLDFSNNVDLGIVGNYNDGTYRHSGIFRDATDGYWKVFDNYTQEPGNAININTEDSSYREANFKANIFLGNRLDLGSISGNSIVATGNIFTSRNVIATAFRTAAGDTVWHSGNDGAGSGLDADLLDGQNGTYYLAWANQTGKPSLNLAFTGDVTGTGNINLTNTDTNSLSIALTVAADSVALGTDTTGNYVANVIAGTGLLASGGGSEGSVVTVSLPNSGVTAGTYGNANVVSQITVDAQGRITSAANVTINKVFNLISGNTITSCGLTQHTTINTNAFNFFAGQCAGNTITSGSNNIFLGNRAGCCTTVGSNNNFFGLCAGFRNGNGAYNNFFGFNAGLCNTDACDNNFFGRSAGCCNTLGCNNNFFGQGAGNKNTVGNYNNFFGSGTGACNDSGSSNNFFGLDAGRNNTAGNQNNFFGDSAGNGNTTGSNNNFFGRNAGLGNSSGSNNIFIGQCAGCSNSTGNRNLFLGLTAGGNISTGNDNIVFGNITNNVGLTTTTSNTIIMATGGVIRFCNTGPIANTTITGNIIAGSSGTFFGDGGGITGINYCNVTLNRPAANIILTGDVTGSANAVLTPGSTVISIAATIASDSVALGTDTTGSYTARVVGGTGITATGTTDEGNVITVGLGTSGVSAGTYGNASTVSQITVDSTGRITSAANVAIVVSETDTLATVTARGNTSTHRVTLTNTTESVNTSSGAFVVSGGVGIAGNINGGRAIVVGGGHATGNVGANSAIIGGRLNINTATESFMGGGIANNIKKGPGGEYAAIIGGDNNIIDASTGALSTTIIGSSSGDINGASDYSTIIGSLFGYVQGTISGIYNSQYATITNGSSLSVIVGSEPDFSAITASLGVSIISSYIAKIDNSEYSTILGGANNSLNGSGASAGQDIYYSAIIGGSQNKLKGNITSSFIAGSTYSNIESSYSTTLNGYYSKLIDQTTISGSLEKGSQFGVGPYVYTTVSGKHVYAPRTVSTFSSGTAYGTTGSVWGEGSAQIGKQLLLGNLIGAGTVTLTSTGNVQTGSASASNTIALDRAYTVYIIKGTVVAANVTGATKTFEFTSTAKRGQLASSVAFVGSYGTANAIVNTLAADTGTSGWEMQLVRNDLGYVAVRATTNTTDNVKVLASIETSEMTYRN